MSRFALLGGALLAAGVMMLMASMYCLAAKDPTASAVCGGAASTLFVGGTLLSRPGRFAD